MAAVMVALGIYQQLQRPMYLGLSIAWATIPQLVGVTIQHIFELLSADAPCARQRQCDTSAVMLARLT